VEFRILGPLEVVRDGRAIELGGGRQRALLALLLLRANEVVAADRLIDELWGERPTPTAPKALQNLVSQLRKSLGDGVVVTRTPGYALRARPEEVDARRFERLAEQGRRRLESEPARAAEQLREALELWRGDPLADFAYESFAQAEAARLQELRLVALEDRIEADLTLGRHATLVPELELLVAEHPLRERPRGQLMLALYRSHRQADALDVHRDGRLLLDAELGLQPGEALQQLERAILNQDPELMPPAAMELQTTPHAAMPGALAPTGTVTFLFSDIEGSTVLVRQLGDDYGALLEQHHRLLRAAFGSHDGHEVDNQGDAFFFAFRRARDAVAAAVAAQRSLFDAGWPRRVSVRVRIGIHTGEPVLGEAGYHGLDVVRAARIGAAAYGGQILVSTATRDVVGDDALPEVSFVDLGDHRLKDFERSHRLFQVAAPDLPASFPTLRTTGAEALTIGGREDELAAAAGAAVAVEDGTGWLHGRRRLLVGLGALALVAAAAVAGLVFTGGDDRGASVVAPNSVARIDPESNEIATVVRVGQSPGAVTTSGPDLWVANPSEDTLTHVDTRSGSTETLGSFPFPNSLDADGTKVWVGNNSSGVLVSIDGETGSVFDRVRLPGSAAASFVAHGGGSVWVTDEEAAIRRVNPATHAVIETWPDGGAHEIVYGHGAAWVVLGGPGELLRIDSQDGTRRRIGVGSLPGGAAVGFGAVWVTSTLDDQVRRVNALTGVVDDVIDVGDEPSGIATGAGSVWVANRADGTVSRIDPETDRVVATIRTGRFPVSLHVGAGGVWVTVSGTTP
jgi:YVTN family beta-propeller protein